MTQTFFHAGDSGYPLEPWLLTPVPGHPSPASPEGLYNAAHVSMRLVVERSIGVLKSRFRCLQRYRMLQYQPVRAAHIIAACAALHNLCLETSMPPDDEDDAGTDDNGPPLRAGYLRGTGTRLTYLQGVAMRNSVIDLFRRPRRRRMNYVRMLRQQFRRQSQAAQ